jgi:hypothetical protein
VAGWRRFDGGVDVDLDLGEDLRLRVLAAADAALLAEATSGEPGRSLWGAQPAGPYSLRDAHTALASWDPAAGGQFSLGILRGQRLLGAVGLMPDPLTHLSHAHHRRQPLASPARQRNGRAV